MLAEQEGSITTTLYFFILLSFIWWQKKKEQGMVTGTFLRFHIELYNEKVKRDLTHELLYKSLSSRNSLALHQVKSVQRREPAALPA